MRHPPCGCRRYLLPRRRSRLDPLFRRCALPCGHLSPMTNEPRCHCLQRYILLLFLVGVVRRSDHPAASAATLKETSALLRFKDEITGDPSGALSSWSSTGDPCRTFSGVTCSSSGSVVKVLLHGTALSGELPTSVSSLPSLRILSLFDNRFSGPVPIAVSSIPTLFKLNLSRNAFTGPVPPQLGYIPPLRLLDLSWNNLSGPIPVDFFARCVRTRYVSLSHNSLSGAIPDTFASCNNLEGLDLSSNQLTGGFPSGICASPKMAVVYLGGNSLVGPVADEAVVRCRSLQRFDVGDNSLDGPVPLNLLTMENLTYFNASFNRFEGQIAEAIPCGDRVSVVDVEGNAVGGGIGSGSSIFGCNELRVLNLGSNRLVGGIPAEIRNLRSLSVLKLGGNELMSGEIPPEIGAIELLVVLDLHRTNLSGNIPHAIGNLRFLLELNLADNHLEGGMPGNIYNTTYLKILDLHGNVLTGGIPPSLGALGGLEYLDLSENSLDGPIPEALGDLTRLKSFNLSYNKLSGEIPSDENLQRFGASAFSHNPDLCGSPLANLCNRIRGERSRRAKLLSASAIIAIAAAAAIFAGVCAITLVNLWLRKRKNKNKNKNKKVSGKGGVAEEAEEEEEEEEVLVSESITAAASNSGGANLVIGKLVLFSKNLPSRYEDWEAGTKALLDKDCVMGSGTIGSVYRASLEGGISIAVKKLETVGVIRSQDEFEQEIGRLGSIRHPNLVEVQGYYWSTTMQLILMEFVPNGNLQQHLHGRGKPELDWPRRFGIALGTARALAFLHHDCKPQILHLNVKAANVLLDQDYQPKLSDYGLVKLLPMLGGYGISRFHSAAGYVAPELAAQSLSFSDKSDVYSFGVLLLEIVARKKPVERSGATVVVLSDFVRRLSESGNASCCIDRSMLGFAENELIQVLKLGLICTTDDPSRRPSMAEVVQFLESIKPVRGSPSQ